MIGTLQENGPDLINKVNKTHYEVLSFWDVVCFYFTMVLVSKHLEPLLFGFWRMSVSTRFKDKIFGYLAQFRTQSLFVYENP